jgi:hypothetical protein
MFIMSNHCVFDLLMLIERDCSMQWLSDWIISLSFFHLYHGFFYLVTDSGLPLDRMGRSHSLSMFSFVAVKSGT